MTPPDHTMSFQGSLSMHLHASVPATAGSRAARFLVRVTATTVMSAAGMSVHAADCAALSRLSLPDVRVDSATLVPAGPYMDEDMDWLPAVEVPEHCRVRATIRPTPQSEIRFEVWMPASGWNGRLQGIGNGGYAGTINTIPLAHAVRRGYAAVSTDTGHVGDGESAAWAKDQPEKLIDFGHRAIHLMTVNAKSIIEAYYGERPRRAYFAGCSNGGRQALMSVQRYPEDYDGVIAGAPAYDWSGLMLGFIWNSQAQLATPESFIPAEKAAAIQAAVNAQCDHLDGVVDGIVGAPLSCRFDPHRLLCQDDEREDCLTRPQIETLQRILDGPRTRSGEQIFPGFTPGAEVGVLPGSGWDGWILGEQPGEALQSRFALTTMRNIVMGKDAWSFDAFDFERDVAEVRRKLDPVLSATDPDLSRFAARGGKLILFHGWADAAIPPLSTIRYYERVIAAMGEDKAAATVRLFMVPGLQHCFPGVGPWSVGGHTAAAQPRDPGSDLSAALELWVEEGVAPESVRAVEPSDILSGLFEPTSSGIKSSALLCAYPKRAKWNGVGNPRDASTYECVN